MLFHMTTICNENNKLTILQFFMHKYSNMPFCNMIEARGTCYIDRKLVHWKYSKCCVLISHSDISTVYVCVCVHACVRMCVCVQDV